MIMCFYKSHKRQRNQLNSICRANGPTRAAFILIIYRLSFVEQIEFSPLYNVHTERRGKHTATARANRHTVKVASVCPSNLSCG